MLPSVVTGKDLKPHRFMMLSISATEASGETQMGFKMKPFLNFLTLMTSAT